MKLTCKQVLEHRVEVNGDIWREIEGKTEDEIEGMIDNLIEQFNLRDVITTVMAYFIFDGKTEITKDYGSYGKTYIVDKCVNDVIDDLSYIASRSRCGARPVFKLTIDHVDEAREQIC